MRRGQHPAKQTVSKQSLRKGGGRRSHDTIKQIVEGQDDDPPPITLPSMHKARSGLPQLIQEIFLFLLEYNSSVEKERLHNIMVFGKDRVPTEDHDSHHQQRKTDTTTDEEVDRFDEGKSSICYVYMYVHT